MHRRRRRAADALTAAVVLGAISAPGAAAHVTVQPVSSQPAQLQRYRVIVPNERASSATTGVDLKLPAGVTFALAEQVAGWRARIVKRGSAISELRWRGGPVPPGGYAELRFIARNPVRVGPVTWKALQRYDDRSVVRWIGGAGSETPAPVTTLSESAAPVDVVSTHGEDGPPASGPSAAAAAGSEEVSDAGRDGLTLALAIAGALLGAAALVLQLRHR